MNKTSQSCSQLCNRFWCNIARFLLRSCASSRTCDLYFFVAGGDGVLALFSGILLQFVRFRLHVSSTPSTVQCFGFNTFNSPSIAFVPKQATFPSKALSKLLPKLTPTQLTPHYGISSPVSALMVSMTKVRHPAKLQVSLLKALYIHIKTSNKKR